MGAKEWPSLSNVMYLVLHPSTWNSTIWGIKKYHYPHVKHWWIKLAVTLPNSHSRWILLFHRGTSQAQDGSANVCLSATEDQIPHGFPTIDMGPQLKVIERTRTATMLCAASGHPDPEIYWFKDFLPVDISGSNGRIKQLRSGKVVVSTDLCTQLNMLVVQLRKMAQV